MPDLRTTTGGGTQNATGTPQSAGGGNFGAGRQSSTVQPGTPQDSLNNGQGGIPLGGSRIAPITLGSQSTTTTTPKAQVAPKETSPLATVFSILLILVAVVVVVSILRPVKNTTE